MAGVPVTFRDQRERQLINFDFIDFASGRGIVEFFLGQVAGSNILSQKAFYSNKINFVGTATSGTTDTKSVDKDFDAKFEKPVTVEGDALFNIAIGATCDTDNFAGEVYVKIIVRKWDGATETDLVTSQGTTFVIENIGQDNVMILMTATKATIPKTSFKIGESLRVTVEIWGKRTSASGSIQPALVSDPAGRLLNTLMNIEEWTIGTADRDIDYTTLQSPSQGTAVTISKAQIPFRIDI
tara:strand:+ start:316 stop:1035 length:720 start_codon:yes stop_codon:yes gene_type:complete